MLQRSQMQWVLENDEARAAPALLPCCTCAAPALHLRCTPAAGALCRIPVPGSEDGEQGAEWTERAGWGGNHELPRPTRTLSARDLPSPRPCPPCPPSLIPTAQEVAGLLISGISRRMTELKSVRHGAAGDDDDDEGESTSGAKA